MYRNSKAEERYVWYLPFYFFYVYSVGFNSWYIQKVSSLDFVQAFKIVVDFWKFSMLLLYILWDDWLIFMISGSNDQLQQQLEYTLQKPDCHGWWISKMQSGREEERYAIKFCFKLGKNAIRWKLDLLLWTRDRVLRGRMIALPDPRRPHRANPSTNFWWSLFWQHWHDLYPLGSHWKDSQQEILCWGLNGVQKEIPLEEASTLQIGSVAFPPGQYTSPQLHRCHRLFDPDGHQDSPSPSLQSSPCLPVTFGYSLSSEAVVMRQLRRWKSLWRRSLTCSHKRTSMGPSRSCWIGTTSAL